MMRVWREFVCGWRRHRWEAVAFSMADGLVNECQRCGACERWSWDGGPYKGMTRHPCVLQRDDRLAAPSGGAE